MKLDPIAVLGCVVMLLGCEPPRVERWGVADRAGNALVRLDGELCALGRWPVPSPRELLRGSSGTWVACASSAQAELPDRLGLLDERGGTVVEHAFRGILDLCGGERGTVLVVDRTGERARRLWRADERGRLAFLGEFPRACAVAARAGAILLGGETGELALLRADGAVIALSSWPGPVRALAAGPDRSWWVLSGAREARLGLAGPALEPRWRVDTGLEADRIAAVAGEERAWLADGRCVRRYGPRGALEVELGLEGGRTPYSAGWAARDAVLLAGVGALLEVEVVGGRARVRRTQGGFSALGGIAAVARERSSPVPQPRSGASAARERSSPVPQPRSGASGRELEFP